MSTYEEVYNYVKEGYGLTDKELKDRIYLAQLWHNPLNYSDGSDLKEKYGWDITFTEALSLEKAGRRYYFQFHKWDLTKKDNVLNLFKRCSNFKKYSSVWRKHAPEGLKNPAIYLLALTTMTVKGFKHEKWITNGLRAKGHTVVLSTPREDLDGIDAWVDGLPTQFKSRATAANMPEWVDGIRIMGV